MSELLMYVTMKKNKIPVFDFSIIDNKIVYKIDKNSVSLYEIYNGDVTIKKGLLSKSIYDIMLLNLEKVSLYDCKLDDIYINKNNGRITHINPKKCLLIGGNLSMLRLTYINFNDSFPKVAIKDHMNLVVDLDYLFE